MTIHIGKVKTEEDWRKAHTSHLRGNIGFTHEPWEGPHENWYWLVCPCSAKHLTTEEELQLIVLMQNDYPIGIYTTPEQAEVAATAHYEARYKYTGQPQEDFHYRQYQFKVDGEAK